MTDKTEKKKSKLKYAFVFVLIAVLAGAGFWLHQNSSVFSTKNNIRQDFAKLEGKLETLEQRISVLEKQTPVLLREDVAILSEKIDDMQKINVEILNSKASIASMMGVVERLDALEGNVKKLGTLSSHGALVLVAATLVDEAAKNGKPFVYEASVLQNLSQGLPMEKSAYIIASYAPTGIATQKALIQNFEAIYQARQKSINSKKENENAKTTEPASWKEKIISKLAKLIQFKKIEEETQPQNAQSAVLALVQKADFDLAILKMETDSFFQTEAFEIWKEEVRAKKIFNAEISKIKALTLGQMKAEQIKKANSE